LEGDDVFDVAVHQVTDHIPSDGAGEGLLAGLDQLLGFGQAKGMAAVSRQDGSEGFSTSLGELLGQEALCWPKMAIRSKASVAGCGRSY
jgi:hypothetical protein